MRLKNIISIPHPAGNRIDLKWINPEPDQYPGVRVVRREATHPATPGDGILVTERNAFLFSIELGFQNDLDKRMLSVALRQKFLDNQISLSHNAIAVIEVPERKWQISDGTQIYFVRKNSSMLNVYAGLSCIVDQELQGETVYYYHLFPYKGNPPEYQIDPHNRTAAMATTPYNLAGQMYDVLPGIYHRYDTVLPKTMPEGMSEEDKKRGQLRRFLDLPGSQLDQLYSFAKSVLELHNVNKVDGRLLPLMAQWIGWQTDYSLEIQAQRNEIRSAPAIYKTIGLIPTVEATVKRISGWESRTKEFVHNVFMSNRPERLNIWANQRSSTGEWSKPTEPLSLDFAYEGRPAAVRDGEGTIWLFYHTLRKGQWDIWYKTLSTFNIELELQNDLDKGTISKGLLQAFEDEGFSLSQNAKIEKIDNIWLITDADNEQIYTLRREEGKLNVYKWTASQPFTDRMLIDKYPTAVMQEETLWVFWSTYDKTDKMWRINYRTRTEEGWSPIKPFQETDASTETEQKKPWAVVDNNGGLWLFWLEKVGLRWQMKYNRHNGSAWKLDPPASFPLDVGGEDPRVESDLFVLFHPTDSHHSIWVFWARKEPTSKPDQTRWTIVYRVKVGIDPTNVSDWSTIHTLPKELPDSEYHDREPVALVKTSGNIELFWSSTRDGSWSIWRSSLLDIASNNWAIAEQVTDSPYSQRDPLALIIDNSPLLIYRSNKSISYQSNIYNATKTVDFRYAGCTTINTTNADKIGLRGKFEDFQAYTYDAGINGERTDNDWYARDTIGLYMDQDTIAVEEIVSGISRIRKVLTEFMPITDRAVFIIEPDLYIDYVYTYEQPRAKESRYMAESYKDILMSE